MARFFQGTQEIEKPVYFFVGNYKINWVSTGDNTGCIFFFLNDMKHVFYPRA